QYRTPIDFTDEAIAAATNGWHTIKEGLLFGYQYGKQLGWDLGAGDWGLGTGNIPIPSTQYPVPNPYIERFQETVNNDFNFPGGLTVLFELAKELRREGNIIVHEGKTETSPDELKHQWQTLVTLARVLGLEAKPEIETSTTEALSDAEIEAKIQQRQEARKGKNFAESDRIRDELQAEGITLIDSRDGTRWHRN
ncbi:MAG: cysteine--tRNA ligase, partial [Nostoc sp. C3-bin3]|nr:cysteine--tRNA ligase [Nostoc sp. C3-bin3]